MRDNSSKPRRRASDNNNVPEPDEDFEDVDFEEQDLPDTEDLPTKDDDIDIDYQVEYNNYLETMSSPWNTGKEVLTYDEFVEANFGGHEFNPKLSFLPPISTTIGVGGAGLDPYNIFNLGRAGLRAVNPNASKRFEQGLRMASQYGITGEAALKVLTGGKGDSDTGGPGGPNLPGTHSQSGTHPFDFKRMNLNAKPIEVRLSTDIKPNCYAPYFDEPAADRTILHLTGASISFNSSVLKVSDRLYLYFDNVVSFIFQNIAQMSASFNIQAATVLTTAKLIAYFDALAGALQLYYFYGSIITYCDNPGNHNLGMLNLRAQMTAEDLNDLWQMKRLLNGFPIPPNLNTMCFYLMQTYKSSSLPGAELIKINPVPFVTSADTTYYKFTSLVTGQIAAYTAALNTTDNRAIASLLSRVCPDWIAKELLVPGDIPLHDPQFSTIWSNLPGRCSDTAGALQRVPTASSSSVSVSYQSHTDELDGAVFGLTAICNTGSSNIYYPSLISSYVTSSYFTSGTRSTNRISFNIAGDGTNAFMPVCTYMDWAYGRGETYIITSGLSAQRKLGTESILNVNIDSVRETAYALLEWLISLDSIGSGSKELKKKEHPRVKHVNAEGSSEGPSRRKKPYKRK